MLDGSIQVRTGLQLVGFRYRAFASGQTPVHWVVHFDPRGKHNPRYRCKNVNLVEKTDGERRGGRARILVCAVSSAPCPNI
jgi:hypothetical protein